MLDRYKRTVGIDSVFLREWQQYQGCLYRCCLRRMRGNQTEAEDALSMAMLRAREGWRTSSKAIDNVKGWLVRLVNNICTNLLKKRDRLFSCEANEELWVSQEEEPDLAA